MATTTTADRAAFRTALRAFLAQHSNQHAVRRLIGTPTHHDPVVWAQLVDQLGIAGLIVPEELGGQDLSFAELAIALEESGRSLLSGPFLGSAVLSTVALLSVGDRGAVASLLRELAEGETVAALAVDDLDTAVVRAVPEGSAWRLSGTKTRVFDAQIADQLLVVADTSGTPTLFVVPASCEEVLVTTLDGMDLSRPLTRVEFAGASAQLLDADFAPGLDRTLDLAAIAVSAELVGVAERSLEIAVQYAKDRIQFGRTIGNFQAIKHLLADSLALVEQMRAAVEMASADAGAATPEQLRDLASVVKAYCSDAASTVAENLIQVLGGIGYTWEHPAHLYLRRAKTLGALFGDAAAHRDRLAADLGLIPA